MKFLIIFVSLAITLQDKFSSSLPVEDDDFEPEELECISELKLQKDAIKKINDQQYPQDDDEDYNNFVFCYWKKMKWQNDKGDINYDLFKTSIQDQIREELEDENKEVLKQVNEFIVSGIDYCQKNPPAKGSSIGQNDVRIQNCILKKIYDSIPN